MPLTPLTLLLLIAPAAAVRNIVYPKAETINIRKRLTTAVELEGFEKEASGPYAITYDTRDSPSCTHTRIPRRLDAAAHTVLSAVRGQALEAHGRLARRRSFPEAPPRTNHTSWSSCASHLHTHLTHPTRSLIHPVFKHSPLSPSRTHPTPTPTPILSPISTSSTPHTTHSFFKAGTDGSVTSEAYVTRVREESHPVLGSGPGTLRRSTLY